MIVIEEVAYRLQGRDSFVTKRHSHNAIELIECVQGRGVVLKDDRSYPLKDRYIYLIDARRPHNVHPIDCAVYVRNKIVMEADSFFAFCREAGISEEVGRLLLSPPISTALRPEIDRIFETVATLSEADGGFAHGYILQLLHLCKKSQREVAATAPNAFVERALAIIAENAGGTSLEAISAELHLNKYYLCHLFKNKTGITLSDYIAEKRMELGTQLLRDTVQTVEEIASVCGFASASSFTRFFKARSGVSPRAYRKAKE